MSDRATTGRRRGFGRSACRAAGGLLCLATLAGCAATDTYSRPGTWHPDGANAANIAAMAADPEDLRHGRGEPGSVGRLAVQAIDRRWDAATPPGATSSAATGGTGPGSRPAGGPSAFAAPVAPGFGAAGTP
jgi:hypothetical protein